MTISVHFIINEPLNNLLNFRHAFVSFTRLNDKCGYISIIFERISSDKKGVAYVLTVNMS